MKWQRDRRRSNSFCEETFGEDFLQDGKMMKILITNDDGISSEVLLPLAKWAKRFGEVTVVVPKYEQSGKSHCAEFRNAFEVKQVPFDDPDIKAYTVDSFPADCVRFALACMQTSFDFVISGINRGLNMGVDILYSGTLGAIFEAATHGLPAVALSAKAKGLGEALEALGEIKEFFDVHGLMKKNNLYNVNIPLHHKGIRITRMGERYYADEFFPQGNDIYMPGYRDTWTEVTNIEYDVDAVFSGFISVTPMILERTNLAVFDELKALNDRL